MLTWFNAQGFNSIEDFGQLFDEDIDDIRYTDQEGSTTPAPRSHRTRFKAAVGYYHFVRYYHDKDNTLNIMASTHLINKVSFGKFFMDEYNPNKDIIRYSREYILELEQAQIRAERDSLERAKIQAELDRLNKLPPPETLADKFNRGVKRDPAQFKTFQNELYWDSWYRGFSATAMAQGLGNVLTATYIPSTVSDIELFKSQQTYMYSVLIDRLQTDNSQSILRDHESDKDAQQIIAEVVTYYEKSSMAKNRASVLFSQITSMRLHTTRWNGTIRSFLLHWVEKVREYHRLSEPTNIINDAMKKTILVNLVKADIRLNDVIIRDMQRQRDGEPEYTYSELLDHLLQTADIMDGSVASKRQASANMHEFASQNYDVYPSHIANMAYTSDYRMNEDVMRSWEDIECNDGDENLNVHYTDASKRRDFGPTLDSTTWKSLSKDDQRAWNSVSPDGREKISGYFKKKGTFAGKKNVHPSLSKKTGNTHIKVLEQDPEHLDNLVSVENEEGADEEDQQTDEAEIILQQAQREASGRPFLTKFLGKKHSKNQSPRHLHCTRIVYKVSNVSPPNVDELGGLVDRGANGGLAGKDLSRIAITDRRVDITGINDIRVDNIPIGTVGGVVKTHKGPAIAIFHQYALGDHGNSIHSSVQMESYKNQIDDRSAKVGGTQSITTIDGYVLPLDIINGLPRLRTRPFTDREWEDYPHIVMTSDIDWDPTVLDNVISTQPNWYASIDPKEKDVTNNPFNDIGEYTRQQPEEPFLYASLDISGEIPWNLCVAQLRNLHKEDFLTEEEAFRLSSDLTPYTEPDGEFGQDERPTLGIYEAALQKATRTITQKKYEEIRPYFLYMPKETIEKTLGCTTQYYRTYVSGPMVRKTYRSPFPALNVMRRPESVFTDTIFSKNTPAVYSGGVTMAQIYVGRLTHFLEVYGIKSENQFVNTLLDTIRKRGAMDKLCSDSARVEVSERVLDILRAYHIDDWQSEPYYQHQNFAELVIGQVKDLTNRIMNNSGADPNEWLLVLQYVAFIWNRMARKALDYVTPYEKLYGSQPDISILYKFPYRCPVYYAVDDKRYFPADTNERKGYMVGFSEHVGHGMTFLVLTLTGTVVPRSQLRRIDEVPQNLRADPEETVGRSTSPVGNQENYIDMDTSPERIRFVPTEDLLGRAFLLDEEETGERKKATILQIYNDHVEKGREHPDLIKVRLKVGDEEYDELIAYNEVLNFIQADPDTSENVDALCEVKRILDHYGPLSSRKSDPSNIMKTYQGSKWNILIEWSTGERSWEPLKNAATTCAMALAEYAEQHQLLHEDGWRRFQKIARRKKKLLRLFKQELLAAKKRSPQYMFGVQIPRNHREAMELDMKNGNSKWRDAEQLEISQLQEYNTFKPCGYTLPEGYKLITVHIVYAVKHDGRHKARIVAGGHLTGAPTESTYSGVISLRGMRLLCFVSELNGLNLWTTDVGNAYLEALTTEKLCIKAGPEFGELAGQYLVIYKALYGLKTSGKRWYERLFDVLSAEGWEPCTAEPEIWLKQNGNLYEYIGVYVDDMALGMKDPKSFTRVLITKYGFKLKGTGPISYHLGAEFIRDKDGTLIISPRKYIERMVSNFERIFHQKPKHASSPLEKGDHPEIDTTNELDLDGISKYQSLMGSTNWVVQLGRFDVATANMTMSGFRANPRQGHLTRVFRIYGYLRKMNQGCIRVDTSRYDFADIENEPYDWERSVYKGAKETVAADAPRPLGKEVDTITFHDANLYHDLITGRSVTGILHFINRTPVDWFSKKQNTVETSTYGSEFVAARIAAEQIIDLRNTLRYMGIPIGRSVLYGDNMSVVNSSMQPHGKLTKRHMALSFHRVRECIAAKIFSYLYIPSAENPADILSKHWAYNQVWESLRSILFSVHKHDK